jgi:superfamily II DNA/RNA helicase
MYIISGTPCKILDMIKIGLLKTEGLKIVVLDDADELLN